LLSFLPGILAGIYSINARLTETYCSCNKIIGAFCACVIGNMEHYGFIAVMRNLSKSKYLGVVLVGNIPPQTTDSQLADFLTEINDISSIQFIDGGGADNYQRSCWIHVLNPLETIKKINVSTIAGEKPLARLMGYLITA